MDDFNVRVAGADLFFEPFAGVLVAVAEEDGAGVYFADKVQKVIAIGVGGQIEFVDFAFARGFAARGAEEKCFTLFGGAQAAGGRFGIRVADERMAIFFVGYADPETPAGRRKWPCARRPSCAGRGRARRCSRSSCRR